MRLSRKLLLFAATLALSLAALDLAARRWVRVTPSGQALARYQPSGPDHAVFLGSSLTDAGIRAGLLDTLLGARVPGFRAFNLALAGLSGSENYWMLYKGFVLPRSRPRYLVVEGAGIPFLPPEGGFALEGGGQRVETFRPECLSWNDLAYLAGGFPAPATALSFWLHKSWFTFHHRHEIQARLREGLVPRDPSRPEAAGNPYRMVGGALGLFESTARAGLARLEAMPDGSTAMRRREAHLLDLAALARENGTTLVILRPPLPPSDPLTSASPAFAAYHAAFRSVCDSLGIVYLDFSVEQGCGPYTYSDGIHLDAEGSRRLTACVAEALGSRIASAPTAGR